jgi:hypothetical protein
LGGIATGRDSFAASEVEAPVGSAERFFVAVRAAVLPSPTRSDRREGLQQEASERFVHDLLRSQLGALTTPDARNLSGRTRLRHCAVIAPKVQGVAAGVASGPAAIVSLLASKATEGSIETIKICNPNNRL